MYTQVPNNAGDIEIKRVFPDRAVFIMQDCVCKEKKHCHGTCGEEKFIFVHLK